MSKLLIVRILLLIMLVGGIVATIKPRFLSQASVAKRTFKEPEDDLDEFVGKVKSIQVDIEEHEFTSHFMDFGNRYKRHRFQTSQFARDGKKVEKFNYRIDGVALPKTTYSYDENGVLLKESHYSAVSGKPYLETIYVYDSQGRLKEEIGKNIEENKILSRKLYSHDEKRNYTEVADYDWNNVLRGKSGFIWNSQGRVSEILGYSPQGDILGRGLVTYDQKGNVAEMKFSPANGSAEKKEKYTYEFDKRGNWIKKTLYHWLTQEGTSSYKLMNITHRTLIYY
jgi:hypothetical protein